MFIPDPDFFPSRIQKQQQKRGVEKNLLYYRFLQPQISLNWKLFYFWTDEEKIGANLQRSIELFT